MLKCKVKFSHVGCCKSGAIPLPAAGQPLIYTSPGAGVSTWQGLALTVGATDVPIAHGEGLERCPAQGRQAWGGAACCARCAGGTAPQGHLFLPHLPTSLCELSSGFGT